jgi:methionine-R-sulfoxide reductase
MAIQWKWIGTLSERKINPRHSRRNNLSPTARIKPKIVRMRTTAILVLLAGIFAAMAYAQTRPVDSPTTLPSENTTVKVKVFNKVGQIVEVDSPRVEKSDEEWKKILGPEVYQIARAKGTEAPFCGTLLDNHKDGVYTCVCCGLPLFSSNAKFNSGTGWPSFFKPVADENVIEHQDTSFGMVRNEILCTRCGAHLGHVFDDGPRPTGLRFCVNSESLLFTDTDKVATLADPIADAK